MVEALWVVVKSMLKRVHAKTSRVRINRYLDEVTFRLKEFYKEDTYEDALTAFANVTSRGSLTWHQLIPA